MARKVNKGSSKMKKATDNSEENRNLNQQCLLATVSAFGLMKMVAFPNQRKKIWSWRRNKKGKEREDGQDPSLKDPPVSSSKSVNKGKRLKPQSEKKSRKKKVQPKQAADWVT